MKRFQISPSSELTYNPESDFPFRVYIDNATQPLSSDFDQKAAVRAALWILSQVMNGEIQ